MRMLLALILLTLPLAYCAAAPPRVVEDLGSDLLGDDLLEQLVPTEEPQQELPDLDELRRSFNHPDGGKVGDDVGQPSSDNPLAIVESKMRAAESLIDRQDISGKTKALQGEVIDELDKLITKLEAECKDCKGGQCSKPNNSEQQTAKSTPKPGSKPSPGQQPKPNGSPDSQQPSQSQQAQSQQAEGQAQQQSPSQPQGGEAGKATAATNPQQLLKAVWGQLPERMRQQMLQSSASEFLPEYRDDIEAYFKQLAEPDK